MKVVLLALLLFVINVVLQVIASDQVITSDGATIDPASDIASPIQPPNTPNINDPFTVSDDQRITIVRDLSRNRNDTVINEPIKEVAEQINNKQRDEASVSNQEKKESTKVLALALAGGVVLVICGTIPLW